MESDNEAACRTPKSKQINGIQPPLLFIGDAVAFPQKRAYCVTIWDNWTFTLLPVK